MKTLAITPLTTDRLEEMCRFMPFDDFVVACDSMSYDHLFQLHLALGNRLGDVALQVERRGDRDPAWLPKAKSALNFLRQKRRVVATRMTAFRSLAIDSVGGNSSSSSRLGMLKALVALVGRHADVSRFTPEERAAYDACCDSAGIAVDPLSFGDLTYRPEDQIIVDSNRNEVAFITRESYDRDELACRMAAGPTVIALADKGLAVAAEVVNSYICTCAGRGGCLQCRAAAHVDAVTPIIEQLR